MKHGILVICMTLVSIVALGQKGFVRGTVLDGDTGEGLIGATVYQDGTTNGAVCDFDGNYSLSLDPGNYSIVFQFVSYQSQTVKDVMVESDKTTSLNITLSSVTEELAEIVVTAQQIKDNEVAMLSLQKKAPNVVNGISSQAFRKIGDSDLGSAMKRVTGVSVEGGKYIYVRGLGDRYTKTTLNQMVIPGLDPDKNSVQIDIFPTPTIENVVVYKTFTPDLPGDFTGGLVDVETKNFPDEKITQISVGLEYNPDMHFQNDFVSYTGSSTDIIGFDNGLRQLPLDKNRNIPDISSPQGLIVGDLTSAFEPTMAAKTNTSFMNYGFNILHGNQINRSKATWGYNMVLNYKNETEYYANTHFGEYAKSTSPDVDELSGFQLRQGPIGNNGVLWSVLLAGALKYEKHDFSLMILHNQNGLSQTSNRVSQDLEDNPATLLDDILTYTQRQISTGILSGRHQLGKFNLEWRGSFSNSLIDEPDFRITRIQEIPVFDAEGMQTGYRYSLNTGVGGGINRFWRNLDEQNENFKVDLSYPYGAKNKLKVGGMTLFKQRDFEVIDYGFRVKEQGNITISDNPDFFFYPENIWNVKSNEGTYLLARNSRIENDVNSFQASSETNGAYAMVEQYLVEKFRAIFGLRAEMAKMYYSGRNQRGEILDNVKTLDELDFLPSINLVYDINDKTNFRVSYNKTLARPSFKEKSNAQIYDPISDRTTIGNLDLKQTHIDNYDLRWEYFFGNNELFSISGFYKAFTGHIERTSFQTAPDQLTYTNAGSSTVYGLEVEIRKNLWANFSAGTNFSIVKSALDMNDIIVNTDAQGNTVTEKENRQIWARDSEKIDDNRDMVGQAPYLVNAYLNWNNKNNTLNANLSYNVQGETLSIVGSGRWPDIYTVPFHSLNFNIYRDFGSNQRSRINLRVSNILDSVRKDVYKSYGAEQRTFSEFQPGRSFALAYRYTF